MLSDTKITILNNVRVLLKGVWIDLCAHNFVITSLSLDARFVLGVEPCGICIIYVHKKVKVKMLVKVTFP